MIKTYLIFWLKALFFLPGTFLHELSHFLVARLTGASVMGFSLLPKIVNINGSMMYQFGSVSFLPAIRALNFLVGFAPILLWVLLGWLLVRYGVIVFSNGGYYVDTSKIFSIDMLWLWYVAIQLFFGGFPSIVDIRTSVMGLFSISGFLLLGSVVGYVLYPDVINSYTRLIYQQIFHLIY